MAKYESLDKLKAVQSDLDDILKGLMEKHGLSSLKCGRGSYDSSGNFSFKIEGMTAGGKSKEAAMYDMECAYDETLPKLGTEFKDSRGLTHKITGCNKAGTVLTGASDGKTYLWKNRPGLKAAVARSNASAEAKANAKANVAKVM